MGKKPIRLIIAGGRDFKDYGFFKNAALDFLNTLGHRSDIEVVSGGAKGVDAMGERFAKEEGLGLRIFPADWKRFGLAAGPIRNQEMAVYATHLLSYWNGSSKGTKSIISLADKEGLTVKVVDTNLVDGPFTDRKHRLYSGGVASKSFRDYSKEELEELKKAVRYPKSD